MRLDLPDNTPMFLIYRLAKQLDLVVDHKSDDHKALVHRNQVRTFPRSAVQQPQPTFDGPGAA